MRYSLLTFALLSSCFYLQAQEVDYSLTNPDHYVERIPTSPEVAQLGNFGNLPVDKHTGTVNINVPIHNIDFEGLSIPINLSYNTGGIRVAQEATWVGLGWNLTSNAVISRKINGFDDLLDLANSSASLKSSGYIYTPTVNVDSSVPNQKLTVTDSTDISDSYAYSNLALDMEPDLFTVSLFGQSYSFTLAKWDGQSASIPGINHDNAELLIDYYVADRRFVIMDANGFTYYFDSKELSDPYRAQGSPYYGTANIETEVLARDQVGVVAIDLSKVRDAITSFQLDSIASPFDRKLHFEYEDGLYFTYPSYSHNIIINPNGTNPVQGYPGNVSGLAVDCNITVIKTKYLKRIYGDFGEVEFVLENRDDLYNWEIHDAITGFAHPNALPNAALGAQFATKQRRLSEIRVRNRINEQIKFTDFHYSYFNADKETDVEPERHIRLKLDSVEVDDKQYHFDYFYENSLPAKDSPSTDFWGFYNGVPNEEGIYKQRIPTFGRYFRARVTPGGSDTDKYLIFEGADRSSDFNYGKVGLLKTVYYPTKGRTEFDYEGHRASVQKPFSSSGATVFNNSTEYRYNYQYLERAALQHQGSTGASVTFGVPFTIQGSNTVPGDNFIITADISCGNYGQGSGNCSTGNPLDIFLITNVNNTNEVYSTLTLNGLNFGESISSEGTLRLPNGTYVLSTNPEANPIGLSISVSSAYVIDIPPNVNDTSFSEYEIGGSRIKDIRDYDANGDFVSHRTYNYRETISAGVTRSSGELMNELVFHSKNGYFDYTPEGYSDTKFNMGASALLNGPGNHVSYGQVTEEQLDTTGNPKGSKKCFYHNQRNQHVLRTIGTVPKYGWYNYGEGLGGTDLVFYGDVYYLGLTPNSNAHLNGKMLKEIVYNNNGNPVSETQYEYSTHEIGILDAVKIYYSNSSIAPISNYAVYPMYQRVALLDSTITKQYFDEDSASPRIVTSTVTQEYGNKNNLWPSGHYWPTRTTTVNSEGESIIKETLYPMQSAGPFMNELIAANRRAVPVEVRAYNGTTFLGEQVTEYGPLDALSNKYNPKKIITKKENSADQERITYDLYDNYGNLLQYTLNDDTKVSYLWGYDNQLYPIAKVVNADWVAVQQTLTSSEHDEISSATTTETRMRTLLDKVRTALPNAFVTSYTYKQGVGISSMTDPRRYTTTYEYDGAQRLERVRDADGKILSDNEYKYKTATQN